MLFLFCRSVTLGLQNSVISYQESVFTQTPRSLALQGGWLQRYAYSIGKGGWGRAWYVYPFLVYFTLHWFTHSYMFCFLKVLENKRISKQCDVYSYAIVIWELLTHKIPFEDVTDFFQICRRVTANHEVIILICFQLLLAWSWHIIASFPGNQ